MTFLQTRPAKKLVTGCGYFINNVRGSLLLPFRKKIRLRMMQRQHKLCRDNEPRIPLALQSVFLRGNRGLDINVPPPDYRKCWWRLFLPNDAKATKVTSGQHEQNEQRMEQNRARKPKARTMKVRRIFFLFIHYLNGPLNFI
jgi:hypothetical protein